MRAPLAHAHPVAIAAAFQNECILRFPNAHQFVAAAIDGKPKGAFQRGEYFQIHGDFRLRRNQPFLGLRFLSLRRGRRERGENGDFLLRLLARQLLPTHLHGQPQPCHDLAGRIPVHRRSQFGGLYACNFHIALKAAGFQRLGKRVQKNIAQRA